MYWSLWILQWVKKHRTAVNTGTHSFMNVIVHYIICLVRRSVSHDTKNTYLKRFLIWFTIVRISFHDLLCYLWMLSSLFLEQELWRIRRRCGEGPGCVPESTRGWKRSRHFGHSGHLYRSILGPTGGIW